MSDAYDYVAPTRTFEEAISMIIATYAQDHGYRDSRKEFKQRVLVKSRLVVTLPGGTEPKFAPFESDGSFDAAKYGWPSTESRDIELICDNTVIGYVDDVGGPILQGHDFMNDPRG